MTTTTKPTAASTAPTTPEESVLKEIANTAKSVKAFGKQYEIRKFTLGQWAQAMEHSPYVGALIVQAMKLQGNASPEAMIQFLVQGISIASPAFLPIISIATHEPLEWLEEQDDAIGGVELFAEVVRKNRDFFTQENLDRIKAAFAQLIPEVSGTST